MGMHLVHGRATGATRGFGGLRPRQTEDIRIGLEHLRQRKRRHLDFGCGLPVVAALHRKHHRPLIFAHEISERAVGELVVQLRVRPFRGGVRCGQRRIARSGELLAEIIERGFDRPGRDAIEVRPILVEHDVRRIARKRQSECEPRRRVIDRGDFAGPFVFPDLNGERHRQPLPAFLEGHQSRVRFLQRRHVWLPALGAQQFLERGDRIGERAGNRIDHAVL